MHLHFLLHLAYILGPYLAVWTLFLLTMELIPHSLTPEYFLCSIRSLIILSIACATIVYSVLYLHLPSSKASPKAISGRTSYLQIRLEFLP